MQIFPSPHILREPFQAFGRVKPSTVLTKDIIGGFFVFYIHVQTGFIDFVILERLTRATVTRMSLADSIPTMDAYNCFYFDYLYFFSGGKVQMSTTDSKLSIPVIQPSILRFQYHFSLFLPDLKRSPR